MKNNASAIQSAQAAGYSDWLAADEAALDCIAPRIAPKFTVSAEVIAKRLRAEKRWLGVLNLNTPALNSSPYTVNSSSLTLVELTACEHERSDFDDQQDAGRWCDWRPMT